MVLALALATSLADRILADEGFSPREGLQICADGSRDHDEDIWEMMTTIEAPFKRLREVCDHRGLAFRAGTCSRST